MKQLRPAWWFALAGALGLAGLLVAPRVMPLYDGIGFPDQPYQYAGPAAGGSRPAPVSTTVPASQLHTGVTLASIETGPQIKAVFGPGAITLPGSAAEVVLSATPTAPTRSSGPGKLVGNVYAVQGTSHPGPPEIKAGFANIYLRLPQQVSFSSPPVVVYRPSGAAWQVLSTTQTGADIYAADFKGWGDYALAVNVSSPASAHSSGHTTSAHRNPALLVAAGVVALITVVIVVIRLRSSGSHGAPLSKSQ
jgi:hypothetical protein